MIFINKRKFIHLLKSLSATAYEICSAILQREQRGQNEVTSNMGKWQASLNMGKACFHNIYINCFHFDTSLLFKNFIKYLYVAI
jgi:hypothetical protein